MDNNSIEFTNEAGLKELVELIMADNEIKDWVNAYEKLYPERFEKKNEYDKRGIAMGYKNLISNEKVIYELYRRIRSDKVIAKYYTSQIQGLIKRYGLKLKGDKVSFSVKTKKYELGTYFYRNQVQKGRPQGADNKVNKNIDIIKRTFPDRNEWNKKVAEIKKNLQENTFSIYSFVEYKEPDPNNFKNPIHRVREVKRSLVKFENGRFTIHLMDNFNKINEYPFEFSILPVGKAKSVMQTDEIPISNDSCQLQFFFELGISHEFEDFALGYCRETNINYGFRIGTSVLVKEKDAEEKNKIEEYKTITYKSIDEIPNSTLRAYFRKRNYNFLRPPTIHTKSFENLRAKLRLQENKPKDLRIFDYDIYIATPLMFDEPNEETYNQRVNLVKGFIQKMKNQPKICFDAENLDLERCRIAMVNHFFNNNIERIAASRYLVLIIPKLNPDKITHASKAFLELGIGIYLRRPILILCHIDSRSYLPNDIIDNRNMLVFDNVENFDEEYIQDFFDRNPTNFF